MYGTVKATKVAIYVNSAYKSMEQIQAELKCNYLINGGTFDGKGKPCCWLKVDGKVLHTEKWSDWGFGWNDKELKLDSSVNIGKYRNFISCVALISPAALSYPKDMGNKRGRTALGLTASGLIVPYVTKDGTADAKTPEQLQAEMRSIGCTSALMLDGGISSRGIFPKGKIPANPDRPWLHNYIAIWVRPVEEKPVEETPNTCPYAEPTRNVGRWCIFATRDMNRWVQWQLKRHGFSLDVDGKFGPLSDAALRVFQSLHGLTVDGICGPATRKELLK